MATRTNRRNFLALTTAGATLAGLGDLKFLSQLPLVSAQEVKPDPKVVQLQSEIEPVVRLLEDTPRNRLLEEVAARVKSGLTYQEVVAALLLAGVRNVQPRPSVGHKFHAVLVVNSAHLASISSPDEHRWLPIFWALDEFKSSQARDVQEGNWTMSPVDESSVPGPIKARQAFIDAMENWDEGAADAAVAGLARTAGAGDVFELFARFGARDFRSIGHKAIYVANSWRTLNCVGWRHAEPVLRSLAYALLMHEGDNPAQRDGDADRPWRRNVELAGRIRDDWQSGKLDEAVTTEMLAALRTATPDEACDKVVELINGGAHPQAIWDALFVGSGELLARQPGIVALHAVTTTNALHYAYTASGNDDTRRMLLLQNAAFVALFRNAMGGRGRVGDTRLDELDPQMPEGGNDGALDEIFRLVRREPMSAAKGVLAYLKNQGDPKQVIDAARVLVFLKGTNSHDYKYSSAVLEDYYNISSKWRDLYLASGVFNLRSSEDRDNQLVARTRAALTG